MRFHLFDFCYLAFALSVLLGISNPASISVKFDDGIFYRSDVNKSSCNKKLRSEYNILRHISYVESLEVEQKRCGFNFRLSNARESDFDAIKIFSNYFYQKMVNLKSAQKLEWKEDKKMSEYYAGYVLRFTPSLNIEDQLGECRLGIDHSFGVEGSNAGITMSIRKGGISNLGLVCYALSGILFWVQIKRTQVDLRISKLVRITFPLQRLAGRIH